MDHPLIQYFSRFATLSPDEKTAILDSMVTKKFTKGQLIVKEGQYNKDSFFVLEGAVRQFKMVNGEEITTHFYQKGQWIISLTSFAINATAEGSLECIEDVSIVVGNEQKGQALFKQFPRFETISRAVMETVFLEQQQWMSSYLTETPEMRYLKLMETQPDIFQKLPQYHIATYIGVKPESLSRIRKRVAERNRPSY
ncbi:MAG TPA: Crp/Fnr family transcriptional regulator [Chitinophagaceae bacterium]|nr:Crp/Fnr family transcriptional regulator [Chitinophagaceae bacterium]